MEKKADSQTTSGEALAAEHVRNLIKKVVGQMGPSVSKDEKKEQAVVLAKIFERGMSPKEAMGITENQLGMIYRYGYFCFESGKYLEAREVFKMMHMLEPMNTNFATALGACHQKLGSFNNAIRCYLLAASLSPTDPVPLFYAYDCYVRLKEKVLAGMMLCNVVARAGEDTKYAKIKEKASLLLESLEKEIADESVVTKK